ncbi:MAG: hypothetical protein JXL67_01665 [Calditrichaeota bacterium]|nr:hypothetical protein [Calditrichota bacterium]
MAVLSFFSFFFRNYLRSHRYLRELLLILIFNILFSGFLYAIEPEDTIWTVFAVLGLMLNMVTVPSLFFLEKGNSLYFVLCRPHGRKNFFLAKILLIWIIDFGWVFLFTIIYGLRFMETDYFVMLPFRLFFLGWMMILSILIFSLSFSYRPWIVWLLLILTVFGGILNKTALFPVETFSKIYVLLSFLLPPFLELIYCAVTLDITFWRSVFLVVAMAQIAFYFFLNHRFILRRDFI